MRTKEVKGFITSGPEVGSPLIIYAYSDVENHRRVIRTSPIKSVNLTDDGFDFTTQNSSYRVSFIDKDNQIIFDKNHRQLQSQLESSWEQQEKQLNILAMVMGLFAVGCMFVTFALIFYSI